MKLRLYDEETEGEQGGFFVPAMETLPELLSAIRLALGNLERSLPEPGKGLFNSTHEGLGVLMEEVWELTEAIQKNTLLQVKLEAEQVAAMALLLAAQIIAGRWKCTRCGEKNP